MTNKIILIILICLAGLLFITTKQVKSQTIYHNELKIKLEKLRYNLIKNDNLRDSEKLSILNNVILIIEKEEIKITGNKTMNERMTEIIAEVARQEKFKDKNLLIKIAKAESGFNPDIRGKIDSRDIGLFQINSYWNNDVGEECSFDPWCSTRWVINEINIGNLWKWNTSKHNWQ